MLIFFIKSYIMFIMSFIRHIKKVNNVIKGEIFMARNIITNKIKTTLILVVLSVFVIATFGFMTACKDSDTSSYTESTYSREWTDEQKITNGNFEYGTDEFVATSYPQTSSISGWSVGTDNSSISSSVKSGIISTAEADWTELLNTICDDNVLSKDKLENPSTHEGASGSKMLMINNYQTTYKGTKGYFIH